MEQIEWDSLKLKVNAMLDGDAEVQAIPADVSNLARMLCNAGDANPETRDSLEVSVKNMLKPYPGFWAKRGNQGILPASARAVVDSACDEVERAAIDFWHSTETYTQPLLRKHGKSTVSTYTDASDYASSLTKAIRKHANSLYKEGAWDGTLSGLSDCVDADYGEEE